VEHSCDGIDLIDHMFDAGDSSIPESTGQPGGFIFRIPEELRLSLFDDRITVAKEDQNLSIRMKSFQFCDSTKLFNNVFRSGEYLNLYVVEIYC